MHGYEFYVDPSRCIGCQAWVKACDECETHRGHSMINFDFVERAETSATSAIVCLACDGPTSAQVRQEASRCNLTLRKSCGRTAMSNPVREEEPLWRDEFSVSKADERYVNRRQLAKFLTLGSMGMFAGNLWILVKSWLRKAHTYQR